MRPRWIALTMATLTLAGSDTPVEWDGADRLADLGECTVVDDPAAIDALVGTHAGQTYDDEGITYRLVARIVFPGDTTC